MYSIPEKLLVWQQRYRLFYLASSVAINTFLPWNKQCQWECSSADVSKSQGFANTDVSDLHPPTQPIWTNTRTDLDSRQVTKPLNFQSCRPKGFSSCQNLPCASSLKLQDFSWSREALELLLCFASPDYIDHIDWSQQLYSCKDQLNIKGYLGPRRDQHSPFH